MPVSIRFLGTAAFQITTANGKRILIDPYLDENPVSPVKVADLERVDLLMVTHAATDHLAEINLKVTEAILIGDPGQHSIFEGEAMINLLALENYGKPIAFGEVPVGPYSKLRLRIDNIELVDLDCNSTDAKLLANGKIDQTPFKKYPDLKEWLTKKNKDEFFRPESRFYKGGQG